MISLFFKNCDMISSNISLYRDKKKRYSNPIAGLLTLLSLALTIAASSYFFYEFFSKKSPKAYVLNKFIDDVGIVSTNQNQMFNTLHINKLPGLVPMPWDKRALSPVTIVQYNNGTLIAKYYYDYCNFTSDLITLEHLFEKEKKSIIESTHLCKRYMIDASGKKIYSHEKEFQYPIMGHGMSSISKRSVDFITLVEKCTDTAENGEPCYSEKEIDMYYTNILFTFKFLDNYIDVSEYNTPQIRFLNRIEGMLHPSSVGNNYLTFKAISIITHNGILFENTEVFNSYKYDYRVESIIPRETSRKVFQINCSLQNMSDVYDRSYERLQDVAANIGGIADFLVLCSVILNMLPEEYQTILATENLLLINSRKDILFPNCNPINNNIVQSSNINNNKINKEILNSKLFNNFVIKNNKISGIFKENNEIIPNSNTEKDVSNSEIKIVKDRKSLIIKPDKLNGQLENINNYAEILDKIDYDGYFSFAFKKIFACCFKEQNKIYKSYLNQHYKLYDCDTLVGSFSDIKLLKNCIN